MGLRPLIGLGLRLASLGTEPQCSGLRLALLCEQSDRMEARSGLEQIGLRPKQCEIRIVGGR